MENPFVYGEEVAGGSFTDREEELKELMRDLSRGQNVIIYSPRRYGKTSLIKKALNLLQKKGLITVYVDLYKATSKQKYVDVFARAIAEQAEGGARRGFDYLRRILPNLLPKIVIRREGVPEIEFEYNHRKPVAPLLPNLLESVHKLALRKKKNAVVVFDEFQEIAGFEDDEVEREMRSHFQSHRKVAYVFLGSKQHLMQRLFLDKNRPFYHSGKHFQLGKIAHDKFALFIKSNFMKAAMQIEDGVINALLAITDCHPYYTQLFCSALWDYCGEKGIKIIKSTDIEHTLAEVIKRETHAYVEMWEEIRGKSRLLLEALAKYDDVKAFSADFILENHLGTPSSVQKAIKMLEERGILERQNGNYHFADTFFKMWLLKNIA